jgi:hypothetical protein
MSARIIQVRPSRNPRWQKQSGWEVFEAEGVCPSIAAKMVATRRSVTHSNAQGMVAVTFTQAGPFLFGEKSG